eukprot:gene10171-12477_t
MKIYAILLLKRNGDPIDQTWDLNQFGFFEKGTVKEIVVATSKILATKLEPNTKHGLTEDQCKAFIHIKDHFGAFIYTDLDYPERVAFRCLSEVVTEYSKIPGSDNGVPFPDLSKFLQLYADPAQKDKILQVQNQVDEVGAIMHKNINEALKNTQKMEDLLQQSNDLSQKSKLFLKQAKKTNRRCCIIQ